MLCAMEYSLVNLVGNRGGLHGKIFAHLVDETRFSILERALVPEAIRRAKAAATCAQSTS